MFHPYHPYVPSVVLLLVLLGGGLAPADAGLTVRVSVTSTGVEGWGDNRICCRPISVSADGRFVAFRYLGRNLVPADTNRTQDIFVHDRDADGDGVFDEPGAVAVRRVSVRSTGVQGDLQSSTSPSVSADGRFVAFGSIATNLVFGDTNRNIDIFVHDRLGVVQAVCGEFAATIVGTPPGPDLLWGTPGPDVIQGLGGDDRLSGDSGSDLLCGGSGDDILAGGSGYDQLFGGSGDDRLSGDRGTDLLYGGPGHDICEEGMHLDTAQKCETVRDVP